MPDPAQRLRLIVHLGPGKTGTTSIQDALRAQRQPLLAQGVAYLGLMLEHAPMLRYPWQRAGQPLALEGADRDTMQAQMAEVLAHTLDHARQQGWHTLVWSNEQFLRQPAAGVIMPLLTPLAAQDDVELQLLAYLRRHDGWARSAYEQWSLKNKTYAGPLLTFDQWLRHKAPRFGPAVRLWHQAFRRALVLRNFDAVADVVADFLHVTNLAGCMAHLPRRANPSLSTEELYLRALDNATSHPASTASQFNARHHWDSRNTAPALAPDEFLLAHLPSAPQLAEVQQHASKDRELLDHYLVLQQQPAIHTQPLVVKPPQTDPQRLLALLAGLVLKQGRRIQQLEQAVASLQAGTHPDAATATKRINM